MKSALLEKRYISRKSRKRGVVAFLHFCSLTWGKSLWDNENMIIVWEENASQWVCQDEESPLSGQPKAANTGSRNLARWTWRNDVLRSRHEMRLWWSRKPDSFLPYHHSSLAEHIYDWDARHNFSIFLVLARPYLHLLCTQQIVSWRLGPITIAPQFGKQYFKES